LNYFEKGKKIKCRCDDKESKTPGVLEKVRRQHLFVSFMIMISFSFVMKGNSFLATLVGIFLTKKRFELLESKSIQKAFLPFDTP
jgi:hypothetical protein